MKKVYITAASRWSALYFSRLLRDRGHMIMSEWHNHPLNRTKDLNPQIRIEIVDHSHLMIKASEVLVVVSDFDNVPGGKHVDTGVAIGNGVKVILVGQYENFKQYSSLVKQVETAEELLKELDNDQSVVQSHELIRRNCIPV